MKRFLGPLVLLVLVAVLVGAAGCGQDRQGREDRADDPATPSPTDANAPRVVDIVSGVAAGGEVAETATIIESEAMLTRYLQQFRSPILVDAITAAVQGADLAADRVIGLATIEISCNEPPSATVAEDDGAFVVTAGEVVSPHPECYAAVTSVAVLDLPVG